MTTPGHLRQKYNGRDSVKRYDEILQYGVKLDTDVMTRTWNPEVPDQWVRQKTEPGRQGKTTGKVSRTTNQTQVEVSVPA